MVSMNATVMVQKKKLISAAALYMWVLSGCGLIIQSTKLVHKMTIHENNIHPSKITRYMVTHWQLENFGVTVYE